MIFDISKHHANVIRLLVFLPVWLAFYRLTFDRPLRMTLQLMKTDRNDMKVGKSAWIRLHLISQVNAKYWLIPNRATHHIFITYFHKWEILTDTPNTFHAFPCRTKYFKNYFSPHVINEWNKLDPNIRSSSNYHIFRNALLKAEGSGSKIFFFKEQSSLFLKIYTWQQQ